ncbi:MAG: NAD-dependent epimerase/dehydratase family protein [Sarcina sp.]
MKALITGASGWLGSELTKQLLEKDYKVRALVLESSKRLDELKNSYPEKLDIVLGNICSKTDLKKSINGIDVVYHLAAKVHCQPKNEKDIEDFYKINTDASKLLFETCVEQKIKRVIFYSSVSVYGESENIITSKSKRNPITPYAMSKQKAEDEGMKLFKEKGLPLTIIQPVTVYGGDDVGNFEKMKSFANKGFLPRFGDGNNKKTIIYFEDLIKATVSISEDEDSIGKTIICGTENISLNEIIETFKKSSDKKIKVIKFSDLISNLFIKICSIKLLKPFNKIARQIHVLKSNNEFDIKENKKLVKSVMGFSDYYSKGN